LCDAIAENTDRAFGGHWSERGDIVA